MAKKVTPWQNHEMNIGGGTGKFWGVGRNFAQISPNSPETFMCAKHSIKNKKRQDIKNKKVYNLFHWTPSFWRK